MKFVGLLAGASQTNTSVESFEQQLSTAVSDGPADMLTANAAQHTQRKVRRDVTVESIGLDSGAGRRWKVDRDSTVYRLESKRVRPVRVTEPGVDFSVDGFRFCIACRREVDAAIHGG